jgi:hypothetical protein
MNFRSSERPGSRDEHGSPGGGSFSSISDRLPPKQGQQLGLRRNRLSSAGRGTTQGRHRGGDRRCPGVQAMRILPSLVPVCRASRERRGDRRPRLGGRA